MQIKSNYEPGFYPDLSNDAYHADPAISSSGLKLFAEMPLLYKIQYLDKIKIRESSKYMEKGSRMHTALLEPDEYHKRYAVAPDYVLDIKKNEMVKLNRLRGDWKSFKEKAEAERKEPLLAEDRDEDFEMVYAIKNNSFAAKIIEIPGQVEGSFFGICPDTGLPVRARPDKLVELPGSDGFEGGLYIIDLKTSAQDLSDAAQVKAAMGDDMRHIQASLHTMVVEQVLNTKVKGVLHMVCQTKIPFFCRFLQLQPSQLEQGDEERKALLIKMAECFEKDTWPGYPSGIQYYIDTPGFLANRLHPALQIDF